MMAGLYDTDIRLDELKIAKAANGDAALISDFECLQQDIQCEALTQEKEVFYDEEYGWSLLDFIQAQDDELTRTEMKQRIITKLGKRQEVDIDSIKIKITNQEDRFLINVKFRCIDYQEEAELDLALDRVKAEVVIV
ncbi:DUF2634 domain-containing protein [Anaerovorax sp. IOR16]|uniref:DUF2634 domain-containing protein n=1 Tax=Anaerovorax sp. IOR16 TaxID=2773458 RepID=UPI0019D1B30B|nr:DUF2634 domain-containing protein [Anaerovorax sp. IOR16]